MICKALMLVMLSALFGTVGIDCQNVYFGCPTTTEETLGGLYIR